VPSNYRKKSKKQELKTKDIFSILDQLKDIGCFYLGFTGGEPFMRKDIMEILWYAKRCGFEVIIYTNGSLIDKRIAKELARLRPNKLDITIPAMTKNAFERISGLSGSYNKVFTTVELLYKNGVNLGFKSCILKDNQSQIQDIQNFAHSKGALHRLDNMLSPRLDGSKEPYKYRGSFSSLGSGEQFDFPKCNLTSPTNSNNSTNPTNTKNPINLFKCGAGRSQAAITPFGELKICLQIDHPKYKILDTSLEDAWRRSRDLVASIKPDKDYSCDRCSFQDFCKWCPAQAWLYNGSFTSCEPQSYVRAKKQMQEMKLQATSLK